MQAETHQNCDIRSVNTALICRLVRRVGEAHLAGPTGFWGDFGRLGQETGAAGGG